jgi:hypothetical protein
LADVSRTIQVEAAWKDAGVDAGLSKLNASMAQSEAAAHKSSGAYQEMTGRLSAAGSNISKLETQTGQLALVHGKAGDAAKDHAKGLSGLGNAMGTNIATMAKYTIGIYGAFQAFSALKSGIEGSIKDAIAAEHADRQLAFALDAAGQAGGNAQAKINAFATTLQKTIGISDETSKAIIAMGLNAGLTAEQAKRLEKAALDLSAATGRDLESSAQALIKSLSGVKDRTLATVQGFRDLTEEQLRSGEGIDLVATRYAGAAERMANSTEGMAIRVKESLGELREAFGASILTGIEGITGKLGGFQDIIDRLTTSIKAFTSVMGAMNTAMQNLPGIGGFFQREAGPLAGPVGLLSGVSTRPGQTASVESGKPFGSIAHTGIDALDAAAAKAGGSVGQMADALKGLKDSLSDSTQELAVQQARLAVAQGGGAEAIAKLAAALNAGKSATELELEAKIKSAQVQTVAQEADGGGGFLDKFASSLKVNEENAVSLGMAITQALTEGISSANAFAAAIAAIFSGGGGNVITKIFGSAWNAVTTYLGAPGFGNNANPGTGSGWNTGGTWSASNEVSMETRQPGSASNQMQMGPAISNPGTVAEIRGLRQDLRTPSGPRDLRVDTNQMTRRQLARWLQPEMDRARRMGGV